MEVEADDRVRELIGAVDAPEEVLEDAALVEEGGAVKMPVVSRLPSNPSQWSKTSVPDSAMWNFSGGAAEAVFGDANAAAEGAAK